MADGAASEGRQIEALRFFRAIYGPELHRVVWIGSPRRNAGSIQPKVMGWTLPDERALAKLAEIGERPGHELFFAVAPMSEKAMPSAARALPCNVAWADVDHEPTDDQRALLERLDATVNASGGPGKVHVFVPLSEPHPPRVIEALNVGLRDALTGDNKHSVATLLRLPGSWHRKGEPLPCRTIRLSSGRMDVAALAEVLGVELGAAKRPTLAIARIIPREPAEPNQRAMAAVKSANRRHAAGADRSGTLWGLYQELKKAGVTDGGVILWYASRCDAAEKHDDRWLADDVARFVEKEGRKVTVARKTAPTPTLTVVSDSVEEADDGEVIESDPFAGAERGFTDGMLSAEVAKNVLAERYRWTKGFGWLCWTGSRWEMTPDETVIEAVRRYLIARWGDAFERAKEAEGQEERDAAEELVKLWKSTLSRKRIVAMTALARGIEGILTEAEDFDAHPDLLNAANGVVDLRTGELMPHDPDLLLTKISDAGYHPDARHDDWETALGAIPDDVRDWVQIRYGQGITGYPPPDDLLIFQEGGGENGKSTLTQGIKGALGEYYTEIAHRALIGDSGQHPTELMDFRGARYAVLEELPEEGRLSVNRMKMIAGSPTITARLIRRDDVTFKVTHTAFVNTNNSPVIVEVDHGTWRRLVKLRFPYTYRKPHEPLLTSTDQRGDPNLRQRIQEGRHGQHEAALAWLVDGAVAWYKSDRIMPALPARVERDTREWRARSDLLLAYANERLIFDPEAHVIAEELYADFGRWLTDNKNAAWSKSTFEDRLRKHREYQVNNVERKRKRRTKGLSRPIHAGGEPADSYTALMGLRFHTLAELVSGEVEEMRHTSEIEEMPPL